MILSKSDFITLIFSWLSLRLLRDRIGVGRVVCIAIQLAQKIYGTFFSSEDSVSERCYHRGLGSRDTPSVPLFDSASAWSEPLCDFGSRVISPCEYDLQSSDRESFLGTFLTEFEKSADIFERWDPRVVTALDVLESFMMCVRNFRICRDQHDVNHQLQIFFKLMFGFKRYVLAVKQGARLVKRFTCSDVQSLDYSETIKSMRMAFDGVSELMNNKLANNLRKLYAYCLTQGLLRVAGLELSEDEFSRIEIKNYKAKYSSKVDLWWCVLDTVIVVLERVDDYKQTGEISAFLHGRDAHCDWLKKTDELLALQQFTCNLEAHGTNQFEYFAEINNQIELGDAIVMHTQATTGVSSGFIRSKLHALQLLRATEVTRKASQMERAAPFGVLVHGRSSVGKSSFTKMLFYYYGKLFNLPVGEEYRFVRSPTDKYWSGFESSKWCVQFDDAAFLDPAKANEDPTTHESLHVVGNIPFNPPQAELEMKGRTPVKAELVIVSTNQADLNAPHYYNCPLAVRRRFPFVIKVEPKPEFKHDNGVFLDPQKLVACDGWPDYWIITVQKLEPKLGSGLKGGKDYAALKDVAVYSEVEHFLRDFAANAQEHKIHQAKALSVDRYMADLKVCPQCYMTRGCDCLNVQATDFFVPAKDWVSTKATAWYACYLSWWSDFVMWICIHRYILWILTVSGHYRAFRYLMMRWIVPLLPGPHQVQLMNQWWKQNSNQFLLGLSLMMGVATTLYLSNMVSSITPEEKSEEKVKNKDVSRVSEDDLGVQSDVHTNPEDRFEKEQSQNVWYNPSVDLVPFDLPLSSRSLAGKEGEEISWMLVGNCVRLEIRYILNGVRMNKKICGVFVKSNYLLVNNHAFPPDNAQYDVTIISRRKLQGVSSTISIKLFDTDIVRWPEKELALVCVRSLPPFKDISKYWNSGPPKTISKGMFVRRTEVGDPTFGIFRKAEPLTAVHVASLGHNLDMYFTTQTVASQNGDCGSLIVNLTPRGPILCGLHLLGREFNVGYQIVSREDIDSLIERSDSALGCMPLCAEGAPVLNIASTNFQIVPLHAKSNLRYHPTGSVIVRGGLNGFRPTPRSNVVRTPKCQDVCEHFKYEVAHGAPVMKGWQPWANNLVDMVNPIIVHDRKLLHSVAESFLEDILVGLPVGWKERLMKLSHPATVNGLPGVKFIDGINRSSSMGHPWNCSKLKYLISSPCEKRPDGVDFPDDVWLRVSEIEATYDRGERAYPVFTACLKDEAVSFEKIRVAKTRAFSGAPVDWSLVVRKYFLTFVKLLQDNKQLFEAAPGTNCMSEEWTDFYNYLTHFGVDRIVAGDYSKFDKKMIADFILEAFWIIITLHKTAGSSDEDLGRMWGVATDTAFSFVNFNGDLLEFFGTNPSGHPLTVIINSLVNSLYMRYAYVKLNPEAECHSFKRNVHLMTYGDDNIMGISLDVPWFNHTTIQSVMASIGVKYTMADKESESVPYVNIFDCEFLKRKWRFEKALDRYACPLNKESILKSLTVWTASKSICMEEQFVNVVVSANMEFFWHGKEEFEPAHQFFLRLVEDPDYSVYLSKGGLPDWDTFVRLHGERE